MNERFNNHPRTDIDQSLTEGFTSSPQKCAEYEERGLIATNNLGLRMLVFEAGPESDLWQFYAKPLFTPRILERLERVKTLDPELWQESLTAKTTKDKRVADYISAMQDYGINDPRTDAIQQYCEDAEWRDAELRTRIFQLIEQESITEEEARALCV